jgi:hypothetical protein
VRTGQSRGFDWRKAAADAENTKKRLLRLGGAFSAEKLRSRHYSMAVGQRKGRGLAPIGEAAWGGSASDLSPTTRSPPAMLRAAGAPEPSGATAQGARHSNN